MTNAEKYLKDGASRQFLTEFSGWYYSITREIKNVDTVLAEFLAEKAQPTLTGDERVILKSIQSNENYKIYKRIGRTNYGSLYLIYDLNKETAEEIGELESDFTEFDMYNNLFQFIKERRRILNRRTSFW